MTMRVFAVAMGLLGGVLLLGCGDAEPGANEATPPVSTNSATMDGGATTAPWNDGWAYTPPWVGDRSPDRVLDRPAPGSPAYAGGGAGATVTPAAGVTSVLVLPASSGAIVKTQLALTPLQTTSPILGAQANVANRTCPTQVRREGPKHPYAYVEIRNDSPKLAVVSVWTDESVAGATARLTMTTYAGRSVPREQDRAACTSTVNRACCGGNCDRSCAWPGLDLVEGRALTIPAGGSVLVYVQTQLPDVTAVFALNAKVEALQ